MFLLLAAGLHLAASPAWSLDIVLGFDSDESESPAYDPAGSQLTAIMQAAAVFWQDVIEDSHTLTVDYWWEDLSDPNGTLATHDLLAQNDGRETSCSIRFDTQIEAADRLWYFDPTPADDFEYDMQQTLWRDLTPAEQSDWFDGPAPDLLEVGLRGNAVLSAPDAARNGFDLYSTALHEIGHALGMSSRNISTIMETLDDDYDTPSDLLHGTSVGVLVSSSDRAHIADAYALMCAGCAASGVRRLPAAVDVFCMASTSDWVAVDLPRQDFLGGTSWNTAFNWQGNQVPLDDDDASVRHGGTVLLAGPAHVASLLVADSSVVQTGPHTLTVEDQSVLTGGARISVQAAGTFDTHQLDVGPSSFLDLTGSSTPAQAARFIGGQTIIQGTVEVAGLATFDSPVTFEASSVLTVADGAELDLDGHTTFKGGTCTGLGTIHQNGTVVVLAETTINVAAYNWTGPGSDTALSADLRIGGSATVHSGATFQGSADLIITPGATLEGQATIQVDVVNQGTLGPGLSTGTLIIDADYHQQADGTLFIEITGPDPGTQFDVLSITGQALLDGLLHISLSGPYLPSPGETFEIMTFAALTGQFADVEGWLLGDGLYFDLVYGPDNLTLLTRYLPGDIDGDGFVGGEDLSIILTNWGLTQATRDQGDLDGDGFIGGYDYSEVLTFWGTAAAPQPEPVPEPATVLLILAGLLIPGLATPGRPLCGQPT